MSVSRRSFLATTTGALATPFLNSVVYGESIPSLGGIAFNRGIEFGSAIDSVKDAKYLDLILFQARILTPEWQMKPIHVAPNGVDRQFGEADFLYKLACGKGLAVHGHTLFWPKRPLTWAEHKNFDIVKCVYRDFIHEVLDRFPNVKSWDVLNEIVGKDTHLEVDPLLDQFGLEFVDFCFRTAHEAAPNAKLVLNDYDLTCGWGNCTTKRRKMLALLEQLIKMGTPIHALGIQSHLSAKKKPSMTAITEFISAVGELGLDTYISELDIKDGSFPVSIAERDEMVGEYYYEFISSVLKEKSVKRIIFWNLADAHSNYTKEFKNDQKEKSTDAPAPRPLLFDENLNPKSAFWKVKEALERV